MSIREDKPLKTKAYGHIPHLPGSRMGVGDHHCHGGQSLMCTAKRKEKYDEVIVQEKLDGSCCAVALIDGTLVPLTRSGNLASESRYRQHHLFAAWVYSQQDRFLVALQEGERIVGEWLAQAHGTRYALPHEPFVVFDLMEGQTRTAYDALIERVKEDRFVTPRLLHRGDPISIEAVLAGLEPSGHGAIDPVEGAVWRVERRGKTHFLAKYVRPDKVDGLYLSEDDPVWNWQPDWRAEP
jgi:RNA ligase